MHCNTSQNNRSIDERVRLEHIRCTMNMIFEGLITSSISYFCVSTSHNSKFGRKVFVSTLAVVSVYWCVPLLFCSRWVMNMWSFRSGSVRVYAAKRNKESSGSCLHCYLTTEIIICSEPWRIDLLVYRNVSAKKFVRRELCKGRSMIVRSSKLKSISNFVKYTFIKAYRSWARTCSLSFKRHEKVLTQIKVTKERSFDVVVWERHLWTETKGAACIHAAASARGAPAPKRLSPRTELLHAAKAFVNWKFSPGIMGLVAKSESNRSTIHTVTNFSATSSLAVVPYICFDVYWISCDWCIFFSPVSNWFS